MELEDTTEFITDLEQDSYPVIYWRFDIVGNMSQYVERLFKQTKKKKCVYVSRICLHTILVQDYLFSGLTNVLIILKTAVT